GNLEWEQPYRTDVNEPDDLLIGVSKRSDGGMWYGKLKRGFSQFNVEFHAVDENGEEVDNVLLLSEEPIRSNGNINGIEFSIPGNSGPLWIFREDDHLEGEMLVQCISEDGERLLGENGFGHFEMPEYQHVQGCSDGNGGLWFTWRKYVYSILSVIHFNGDGEMMEGWTEEGIDAFQTPFTATYTYVYPMGENLAIISNNRDYNPFKTLEDNWVMQVLSDREPRFIDNPGTMGTPENHSLLNLYPNPFNSTTRIEYNLPNNGHTRIAIYNLNGCQMDILTNGELAAGIYATSWDASGVPTGVYLCRLEAGGETVTRKLMVLR
ncbi:MAG: T9SS type A sorting domain-containing protein, partial [Calditrichaeota bacterium]|nr:T9SS type A sorting domain-containing protein [Calditrichota bacterium]